MTIKGLFSSLLPLWTRGSQHFNHWIPAFPGNCSCISGTSTIHGGRAGMKKIKQGVTGLFLGLAVTCMCGQTTAAAIVPTIPLYHATYAVNRNDLHIGNAQFSLTREANGTYDYQSVTQASGLASLFFSDVITEISYFAVNDGRLQPLLYSYTHGGHGHDRDQTIRFEWAKHIAESTDGDERKAFPIKPGIYDRALAQLALSVDMAAGRLPEDYWVLDHGEFQNYKMQRAGQDQLKTPAGSFDTVKVARQDKKKNRVTTFWLAPKLHYLPVQMQQTEPGKATITLVLTEIHLDTVHK